jgi:D-lyxose ketol-isomerase
MKISRSVINSSIRRAIAVARRFHCVLPEWAYWKTCDWTKVATNSDYDEIRDCMLGWDVTDFGSDDFFRIGRVLLTLRNGKYGDPRYPKAYAEKLLFDPEDQRAPAHFHQSKREDIIAVAGGNILVQLESCNESGQRSGCEMTVSVNGIARVVEPSGIIKLEPGMSLTIPPRTIHQFWAEPGTGEAMDDGVRYSVSREISSVCDDLADNFFLEPAVRFPRILEDEAPETFLCHEYPRLQADVFM